MNIFENLENEMDESHDIMVKSYLTQAEYAAFISICKESGLGQSAAIRRMIKRLIKYHVEEDSARRAGI